MQSLVVENVNEDGEVYDTFPGTVAGLLGALNNLTQFPNDFVRITVNGTDYASN